MGEGLKKRMAAEGEKVWEHRDAGAETTGGTDFLGLVAGVVFPPGADTAGKLLVLSASPVPFTVSLPPALSEFRLDADARVWRLSQPGSTSTLYLAGDNALVSAFGEKVKSSEAFKGRVKGGGARGRWQAKIDGALAPGEQATLRDLVASL